jgi:xanthine dehydrogenase accessory factor
MKNIYLEILNLQSSVSPLVLATIVNTPQKSGCSALFDDTGLVSGTVGGGIVEGKVRKLAAEAIVSKNSGLYHFNLANDIACTEEAICGGQITVLTDTNLRNFVPVFEQLSQSLTNRIPGVLITEVTGFRKMTVMINRYWISEIAKPPLPEYFLARLEPEVNKLISEKNPSGFGRLEIGIADEEPSKLFFLQPFFPPDQLIIAGAGHIGRALAHLGVLLDFEVTVIDDRQEYANKENIPDADHIIVKEIGEAIDELNKEGNTYVVIVTRGHKDDASALRPCIGKGLAYIGMIGSKKKVSAMRINFLENGWSTHAQWDQIHAPVGLPIKSQTVEEIAISIAAELVMARNSMR